MFLIDWKDNIEEYIYMNRVIVLFFMNVFNMSASIKNSSQKITRDMIYSTFRSLVKILGSLMTCNETIKSVLSVVTNQMIKFDMLSFIVIYSRMAITLHGCIKYTKIVMSSILTNTLRSELKTKSLTVRMFLNLSTRSSRLGKSWWYLWY